MKHEIKAFLLLLIFSLSPIVMAGENKPDSLEPQISVLINGLGAEKFELREESQAKLIEIGAEQYDLVLRKCLESHIRIKDPEIRFRIRAILRPLVLKRNFMQKGFLGISMQQNRIPQKIGDDVFLPVEIVSVMPDFPAEKSGFSAGDQILKVDGNVCDEKFQTTEIVNYISAKKPGTAVTFLLQSDGKQITKEVIVGERPALPNEPTIEEQQDEFFRNWFRMNLKKAGKEPGNGN